MSVRVYTIKIKRCRERCPHRPVIFGIDKSVAKGDENMLEVCFNESVKGAMRYSHYFKNENIICLSFELCFGDISSPIIGGDCPRKEVVFSLITANPWDELEKIEKTAEEYAEKYYERAVYDLERLKTAARGETVRIWADKTPAALCGTLFAVDLLKDSGAEVIVVCPPEKYQTAPKAFVSYNSWGEVEPELFKEFSENEKTLSRDEILSASGKWQILVKENAPLRIAEKGEVISVSEDYYDDFILSQLTENETKAACLIGDVLGRGQIYTGDVFIANRIKALIGKGKIKMVSENKNRFYASVIKK